MLLLLLPLLIVSIGCSTLRPVVLHPIEKSDIFAIGKGTKIGDTITEKDGWFISDYYLKEVAKAKVSK
jgi:hypothetical protein